MLTRNVRVLPAGVVLSVSRNANAALWANGNRSPRSRLRVRAQQRCLDSTSVLECDERVLFPCSVRSSILGVTEDAHCTLGI